MALVAQDFDALKAQHREMGLIFDELPGGIYFIRDPDGHILARPEAGGKAAAEISLEKEENTLGKQQKIGYDKKKEKSTGP